MDNLKDLNEKRQSDKEKVQEIGDALLYEFVGHYIEKMHQLDFDSRFKREDGIIGKSIPHIMMYKLKIGDNGETIIMSKDGHRGYEFLVEFDKDSFEYGIYYGCRATILKGDISEEIHIVKLEWEHILSKIICQVLDNTFIGKKFRWRFLPTNNANDNTYWAFWITLASDEDIVEVAARATYLIGKTYKYYLEDNDVEQLDELIEIAEFDSNENGVIHSPTRFSNESYEESLIGISKIGEVSRGTKEYKDQERARKRAIFEAFIDGAIRENIIEIAYQYEKGFNIVSIDNVTFAHLLVQLCLYIKGASETEILNEDLHEMKIPWGNFTPLFLSARGEVIENIKKSYSDSLNNRKYGEASGAFHTQRQLANDLLKAILGI